MPSVPEQPADPADVAVALAVALDACQREYAIGGAIALGYWTPVVSRSPDRDTASTAGLLPRRNLTIRRDPTVSLLPAATREIRGFEGGLHAAAPETFGRPSGMVRRPCHNGGDHATKGETMPQRVWHSRKTVPQLKNEERSVVDRIVFSCVAVALLGLGVCMIAWPAWIVQTSRDGEDSRPVTPHEIWSLRAVGAAVLLGGGYALYAILTGQPGAEIVGP